jgi:phospholipase C
LHFANRCLCLSVVLTATAAFSQKPASPQGKIQHVIVVIQENRTPDNIFGSNPTFEPGVNIATTGKVKNKPNLPLASAWMETCYGLGHEHIDFTNMYDNGAMDGANEITIHLPPNCTAPPSPMYQYLDNSSTTIPPHAVQPYFDIATQFGFANYMFQTNQGGSFPAHQFLFSGTSAPVYNDGESTQYYKWFAAENPDTSSPSGCFGAITNTVLEIAPGQTKESLGWTNPNLIGAVPGYPCYNHNTIATLLDPAAVSWKYYTNGVASDWTAPNAFQGICNSTVAGDGCVATTENPDWNNVILMSEFSDPPNPAQILQDIQSCNLAQVSFITPDGTWSDHGGNSPQNPTNPTLGPSWVASIVNAIGQGMTGSVCNPLGAPAYWDNTVILITWDDWGGLYDHVAPPSIGYINSHGSGSQFVYGFRVPLLVVSAYSPKHGYVSGPAASSSVATCPKSPNPKYCHDFGSILNFIEYVFGSGGKPLGEIYKPYHYADYYALDGPNNTTCAPTVCPYGLSDFFNFSLPPAAFTPISTPYDADYFINYSGPSSPPDDD